MAAGGLVVDDVIRRFGGLMAVSVDHLEVQRGAITALIGPNGAGKTTFFNLLTCFDTPDTGTWHFNGLSMNGVSPYKAARRGMVRAEITNGTHVATSHKRRPAAPRAFGKERHGATSDDRATKRTRR